MKRKYYDNSIHIRDYRVLSLWNTLSRIPLHYSDVIIEAMASQITGVSILYTSVFQAQIDENIKGPRHWPLWGEFSGVNSPHKGPITRKMLPFDDVIMFNMRFVAPGMVICIIKIRRSWDRFIFISGIPGWKDGVFILKRTSSGCTDRALYWISHWYVQPNILAKGNIAFN